MRLGGNWPDGGAGPEALRAFLPEAIFEDYEAAREHLASLERQLEVRQLSLGLPRSGDPDGTARLRAVQAVPGQALHYLIRRIYTVYTPAQLSEQAAAFLKTGLEHIVALTATNLTQIRQFVDEWQAELDPAEWELYLRPDESLARRLGQSLANRAGSGRLLVTVDDFALPEGTNDRWLRALIEASGRTLWLFAAERSPGWNESILTTLQLALLSAPALTALAQARLARPLEPSEALWFQTITGGEPLAAELVAALLAGGALPAALDAAAARTPEQPTEGLFLHFVEESGLLDQAQRMSLYRMAILYKPTPQFLILFQEAVATAGYDYDPTLAERLLQIYPWLADGGREALQPFLKETLRRFLLVERYRFSAPVQEGIVEPARNAAIALLKEREAALVDDQQRRGSLASRARDRQWGELVAQVAYYRFWLDEAVGWFFLLPRLLVALAYSENLARQLLALAEGMNSTFYVEGQEILPFIRTLLAPSYTGGRARLDDKLQALDGLEELGTSARGRWYRAENLGQRPESGGSPEAELRGLLKWFQARIYEEAGQYERTAPLYESVLATNVSMPDLERAAAQSALYLAARFRLKGSAESAFSALSRAVELDPSQPHAQRALFFQAVRTGYFPVALKAADALTEMPGGAAEGALYTVFALYALERLPDAQTELRAYLSRPAPELAGSQGRFLALLELAGLPASAPGLDELLSQLPA